MVRHREPWLDHHSLTFNEELPIAAHIEEIKEAINNHQVVVVAGETGSGKTTQLSKIALALGRGTQGLIGHTQPRRIAARSLAQRLAEELKIHLGDGVGYQIRFQQKLSEATYVKIMTDGILLTELAHDSLLKKYDTLIIDEAHERSLNIDFIFGCLKKILPKRRDLKVIITSATLDHERFTKYFGGCPLIEVSGRGYPIEIHYHELDSQDDEGSAKQRAKAIHAAIEVLPEVGDILVFLSGERDIRITADFLKQASLKHTTILPLYAKLNVHEQQKIFQSSILRKIILATNVAETSLTIPNIYYVIDTGLARIKRYNPRSKIQRLPIEAISQASANQRAGRAGRVAPGICVRLYSQEDFLTREAFTQPEILRSNLASVILKIFFLNLGEAESFPWIDPPENQHWKDAYQNLFELGAILRDSKNQWQLTTIGKLLAKLPLDPRLSRMLFEAHKKHCLAEVLIIVSALSVGEILQVPYDQRQAADTKQAVFKHPASDFLTYLNLWEVLQTKRHHLTNKQFKKFCDQHFVAYNKWLEWEDIHSELKETCLSIMPMNQLQSDVQVVQSEREIAIHQSLLSGLLTHIGHKNEQDTFIGTRQRQFKIFPASQLAKKPPQWLMALEIVETQKVYARICATIDPLWVEPLASHLIKKTYFSPYFDQKRGEVVAFEKVLFNGLVLIEKRKVGYTAIDAVQTQQIFIREALAQRKLTSNAAFFTHNENFLRHLENIEEKSRRRDLVPDEEWLFQFYQSRIPQKISTQKALEKWVKTLDVEEQKTLMLSKELVNTMLQPQVDAYPATWVVQGNLLKISYQFSPGTPDDGLSVLVPERLLAQLTFEPFDWLVPGLLKEKVLAILKALPKNFRVQLDSLSDTSEFFCAHFNSPKGDFFEALANLLKTYYQIHITAEILKELTIPDYLKFNFKVVREGKIVASGRDLLALQIQFSTTYQHAESINNTQTYEKFPSEALPFFEMLTEEGVKVKKYLALQARGESVALVYVDSEVLAKATHRLGVLKLFQLQMMSACKNIEQKYLIPSVLGMSGQRSMNKAWSMYADELGEWKEFREHVLNAIFNITFADDLWLLRSESEYVTCFEENQQDLFANATLVTNWLSLFLKQFESLVHHHRSSHKPVIEEWIGDQLALLLAPGFPGLVPWEWLERYPAYMAAFKQAILSSSEKILKHIDLLTQLNKLRVNQQKSVERISRLFTEDGIQMAYVPDIFFSSAFCLSSELTEHFFLLQEYQMTLFAHQLKPVSSVSEIKLRKLFT